MDASAWDRRYAESELLWSAEPNRFVAAELADLAPGRAVDLAAGEGRNAIWLASRGWRATAVDFSPVAIDKGRRLAEAAGVHVDWVVADLLEHVPEPAGFDLVLVAYLQLPPEQLGAVLGRAVRAVAPGGMLLVVGHDATNLSDGVGGPQDPDLLYTPESIATRLGGLRVGRADRVRRPVPGAEREAIDTLVRAHRPAP
ncbi:class I SAM-dependent methyltransferase [Plantactinospora sp. S1510]|uniref:Class I SAM-dependent methyltransferase n=1 Tax=Plantactinospora alkalitolerans TaxID=2789879 RepID=A0ABS0GWF4_9ACTN|nr:class I SAM-dependent methyltransferase [Plantactinospora alkalitolerans]MBF9130548.1 class I SAM-dependent methyltransferase [Plantactinospora alkalitolerans]